MFDVGFSEMIVIAVVALIVLGPEKLPRVARTVGALLGRMQRYVNDVKADINREIELDELKAMHTSVKEAAQSVENSVRETVTSFQAQADEMNAAITGEGASTAATEAAIPAVPAPMSDADLAAAIHEAHTQALEPAPEVDPAQGTLPLEAPAATAVASSGAPHPAPEPVRPAA
ncbi:MAG TPA: Sec-independent protein translocase protein TatB [Burkholderiales bacterium]|jgi:sec-independent protein translocase protein TatB|nr:Sec-independent protein translocase protein TatB [Burkholderiales bacterium]